VAARQRGPGIARADEELGKPGDSLPPRNPRFLHAATAASGVRQSLGRLRTTNPPPPDTTTAHQIQSAGPRATQTDKLTGCGVPTSIGALSV